MDSKPQQGITKSSEKHKMDNDDHGNELSEMADKDGLFKVGFFKIFFLPYNDIFLCSINRTQSALIKGMQAPCCGRHQMHSHEHKHVGTVQQNINRFIQHFTHHQMLA